MLARHWKKIGLGLLLLVGLLLPVLVRNQYLLSIIMISYIWAIAVYGMNVLLGYTGQLSLAQAGFFGIGAYTVGIMTVTYEISFWPALLAAVVVSSVVGFVVGLFALRTRNEYFAIFTLGVGLVIFLVIENWEGMTGGRLGLIGVPYPEPLTELWQLYYLILGFLVLTIFAVASIARSLVGRSFLAIRNSEELAMATGINVGVNKQLAFVISTALAGLAGGLYAPNIGFLGPAVANVPTTFNMLLFLLVGGLGSLSGPLVGSLLVATLTQFLQQFQEYQLIVFGPLLVLVVIFFPQGIAGLLHRGETWFRNRGTGTDNGQSEEPAAEESRVEPTKEVR
jgi:branched-chain amino acid transport system permease protein